MVYGWPEHGDTPVPLDTKVWFLVHRAAWNPHVTLNWNARFGLKSTDVQLPAETHSIDLNHTFLVGAAVLLIVEPAEPLDPHTDYCAEVMAPIGVRAEDDSALHYGTCFRTGTAAADPPPAPEGLVLEPTLQDGSCGLERWLDGHAPEGNLVVFDTGTTDLEPTTLSGSIDNVGRGHFRLGKTFCGGWERELENFDLRWGYFNLAGEFSGWSEPQSRQLPSPPDGPSGGACSVSREPGSRHTRVPTELALGVLIGLLLWTRRAERTASRRRAERTESTFSQGTLGEQNVPGVLSHRERSAPRLALTAAVAPRRRS